MENPSRVNWKAFSIKNEIWSKVFISYSQSSKLIRLKKSEYSDLSKSQFEETLSQITSLILEMKAQGQLWAIESDLKTIKNQNVSQLYKESMELLSEIKY